MCDKIIYKCTTSNKIFFQMYYLWWKPFKSYFLQKDIIILVLQNPDILDCSILTHFYGFRPNVLACGGVRANEVFLLYLFKALFIAWTYPLAPSSYHVVQNKNIKHSTEGWSRTQNKSSSIKRNAHFELNYFSLNDWFLECHFYLEADLILRSKVSPQFIWLSPKVRR